MALTWAIILPQNLLEQNQTNKPSPWKSKSRKECIFKCALPSTQNMSAVKCIGILTFYSSKYSVWVNHYLQNITSCLESTYAIIVTPSLKCGIRSVLCAVVSIRFPNGVNQCSFAGSGNGAATYIPYPWVSRFTSITILNDPFTSVLWVCKYWLLEVSSCSILILK